MRHDIKSGCSHWRTNQKACPHCVSAEDDAALAAMTEAMNALRDLLGQAQSEMAARGRKLAAAEKERDHNRFLMEAASESDDNWRERCATAERREAEAVALLRGETDWYDGTDWVNVESVKYVHACRNMDLILRIRTFLAAEQPPSEPCKTCGGSGEYIETYVSGARGTEPCPACTPPANPEDLSHTLKINDEWDDEERDNG